MAWVTKLQTEVILKRDVFCKILELKKLGKGAELKNGGVFL